jgi:ABC-2 type transport system permease protein
MQNLLWPWWQTIKISWHKTMAYRLNFFLQVIGPALVFLFVKFSIWSNIYSDDPAQKIAGFNFQEMLNYHSWIFLCGLLSQGHSGMNLAEDIRLGRISTYLIYPFNFWEYHFASFISFQSLQLLVSLISFLILNAIGLLSIPTLPILMSGVFYCLAVSIFWFTLQFLTGILAFWLEETWVIRVILIHLGSFLSGSILPLDFFPNRLREIIDYTPFPYMNYYPAKMLMTGEFHLKSIVMIALWTLILIIVSMFTWKKGIKNYTAAGI